MTPPPTPCARFDARDAAIRYLAGRLEEPDVEDWERHFFGCQRCWRRVLRIREVAAAFREASAAVRRASRGPEPPSAVEPGRDG